MSENERGRRGRWARRYSVLVAVDVAVLTAGVFIAVRLNPWAALPALLAGLVFAVLLTWGFQIGDKIQEVAGPGAAYDLARQYQRRGSYFKAANTFHDAEMMYRKRLGPDNAWVIRCITGRADCLVKLERFDDAVKMLLQAIPLVEPRGDAAWLESLQTKMRYAQERATPDA